MAHRLGIDTARIVMVAAEIVDEAGIETLTLAELAHRLGVRTPSLYNHIRSLDEVRQLVAVASVRELGTWLARAAMGQRQEGAIFAVAAAYRRFAKAHPGRYAATLRASTAADDAELRAANAELMAILAVVLAPYRLPPNEEIHAMRALRSLVHGFVSLESAKGFGLPVDIDASFQCLLDIFIAGLKKVQG